MKGIVYRSTGSWYYMGDRVEFNDEGAEGAVIITKIEDRKNYINRQSPRHKHQQHIVASNLDQSLLLATVKEPRTSQGFIDRFLVVCEMYHVPAIILFNKTDLYKEKEFALLGYFQEVYEQIGYRVMSMSLVDNKGIENVADLLKGKTTLISGHSGVGKSSFINTIVPELAIKTQDVSGWSGKGQHTTTFAEMYDLPSGGRIIDTPGMKEFGLVGIERQELSGYFPEMRQRLNNCQFNNCMHVNEPGCAIKDAVVEGLINEDRYVSYVNILDSIKEQNWD